MNCISLSPLLLKFRATIQAELEEEFVNFELATIKAQNIRNVNEKEIQRYNAEKEIIRIRF